MHEAPSYDVIIIGAGLTGLLAAKEALAAGASVLMLERGGEYRPSERPERKDLIRQGWWSEETRERGLAASGLAHYENSFDSAAAFSDLAANEGTPGPWGFRYNMRFGLGGSAKVWSGQAWRLLPEDFECASRFGHSADWPLSYAELAPFYDEVEQMMGVSGPSISDRTVWPWSTNYPYSPFGRTPVDLKAAELLAPELLFIEQPHAVVNDPSSPHHCIGAKTCVQRCPTGAVFHPDERWLPDLLHNDRFEILLDAKADTLETRARGHIAAGVTYTIGGKTFTAQGDTIVMASNTIENLMILDRTARKDGRFICNSSGLLGSYFASHAGCAFTLTSEEDIWPTHGRPTHSSALNTLLSSDRREAPGFIVELWNSDISLGYSPWEQYWKLHREEGHWGRTLFEKVSSYPSRCTVVYVYETEMTEGKTCRAAEHNAYLPQIRTEPTSRDLQGLSNVLAAAEKQNGKAGIRSLTLSGYGLNGNHPLGGYRMSHAARDGVTDSFCRSHDISNLLILGGGSFCSTGGLNPSLTIAALALRGLRKHLQ